MLRFSILPELVKGGDLRSSVDDAWVRIPQILFLTIKIHHSSFRSSSISRNSLSIYSNSWLTSFLWSTPLSSFAFSF